MKKLLALLLAVMMLATVAVPAMADENSEPDWTTYDNLIAEIKASTDFAAREVLMHQAEDMLMETNCLVPLYYYNDVYMLSSNVTNVYKNVYATTYFQYAEKADGDTTLKVNLASEPDTLDPALNSSVDGASLATAAFGGLYSYDAESNLVPNFAESYTVSEDGLTWTFTLKSGLLWSDGAPLTAGDFEYAWKRAASAETAADYSYMLNGIAGYDEGALQVTAKDDVTLEVVLSAPCAYFLDLAAFPTFYPVRKDVVESAEGYADASGAVVNPGAWCLEAGFVSCGPFVLDSWTHSESMVYVKNPNWWDAENVKIDRIEFMLSADDTVIYAAYRAGNLDFADTVPNDEIATLLETNDAEFHISDELGTYYSIFNVKSKLFDGKTVEQANAMRKAFSLLIDRDYIVETVGQTGQQPANSFIPAGMLDGNGGIFKADDEFYTFPVETGYFTLATGADCAAEAQELLEFAGFKFDAEGKLSSETPISFEYLTNESSGHIAIAQCIQEDLAVIGVNMTIRVIDWATFLDERKDGNYDVARNGWIADFNDPINMLEMWTTVSGNNDAQFGR